MKQKPIVPVPFAPLADDRLHWTPILWPENRDRESSQRSNR